jgi:hypothetical protein
MNVSAPIPLAFYHPNVGFDNGCEPLLQETPGCLLTLPGGPRTFTHQRPVL